MVMGNLKWNVLNGDCLAVMKTMQSEIFDYTFTSPPYNDSGTTQRDVETGRHIKYKTVEFRKDWFEWQCQCIDEMMRVTKKMVFYNVQPLLSNKADVYRLIGKYADKIHMILVWYKPNAQPQPYANRIGNAYELVLILKCKRFDKLYCNSTHYRNVIVQNINSDRRYSKIHKAMMSQSFANEIIGEFTQEGDYIFDPFCGLGTTGVACLTQGRNFVGIELDEEYCQLAKERILEDTSQMRLFAEN